MSLAFGVERCRRQNDSGFSGVSTGSGSGLDRCASRGLLAGGGIPKVVYGRLGYAIDSTDHWPALEILTQSV
jgi:hypothetical protein